MESASIIDPVTYKVIDLKEYTARMQPRAHGGHPGGGIGGGAGLFAAAAGAGGSGTDSADHDPYAAIHQAFGGHNYYATRLVRRVAGAAAPPAAAAAAGTSKDGEAGAAAGGAHLAGRAMQQQQQQQQPSGADASAAAAGTASSHSQAQARQQQQEQQQPQQQQQQQQHQQRQRAGTAPPGGGGGGDAAGAPPDPLFEALQGEAFMDAIRGDPLLPGNSSGGKLFFTVFEPLREHLGDPPGSDPRDPYAFVYTFWMFYPFNGCSNQLMATRFAGRHQGAEYFVCPLGVHEGDWEHLKVYVCQAGMLQAESDDPASAIASLQYSQHTWLPTYDCTRGECTFERDREGVRRPAVVSGLHSHANNPHESFLNMYAKVNFKQLLNFDGIYVSDRYSKGGPVFTPSPNNTAWLPFEHQMTPEQRVGPLAWATFKGNWGCPLTSPNFSITCLHDRLTRAGPCDRRNPPVFILDRLLGGTKDHPANITWMPVLSTRKMAPELDPGIPGPLVRRMAPYAWERELAAPLWDDREPLPGLGISLSALASDISSLECPLTEDAHGTHVTHRTRAVWESPLRLFVVGATALLIAAAAGSALVVKCMPLAMAAHQRAQRQLAQLQAEQAAYEGGGDDGDRTGSASAGAGSFLRRGWRGAGGFSRLPGDDPDDTRDADMRRLDLHWSAASNSNSATAAAVTHGSLSAVAAATGAGGVALPLPSAGPREGSALPHHAHTVVHHRAVTGAGLAALAGAGIGDALASASPSGALESERDRDGGAVSERDRDGDGASERDRDRDRDPESLLEAISRRGSDAGSAAGAAALLLGAAAQKKARRAWVAVLIGCLRCIFCCVRAARQAAPQAAASLSASPAHHLQGAGAGGALAAGRRAVRGGISGHIIGCATQPERRMVWLSLGVMAYSAGLVLSTQGLVLTLRALQNLLLRGLGALAGLEGLFVGLLVAGGTLEISLMAAAVLLKPKPTAAPGPGAAVAGGVARLADVPPAAPGAVPWRSVALLAAVAYMEVATTLHLLGFGLALWVGVLGASEGCSAAVQGLYRIISFSPDVCLDLSMIGVPGPRCGGDLMRMCNVWRQLRLSGLLYGSLLIIGARLLLLVMATANYHARHQLWLLAAPTGGDAPAGGAGGAGGAAAAAGGGGIVVSGGAFAAPGEVALTARRGGGGGSGSVRRGEAGGTSASAPHAGAALLRLDSSGGAAEGPYEDLEVLPVSQALPHHHHHHHHHHSDRGLSHGSLPADGAGGSSSLRAQSPLHGGGSGTASGGSGAILPAASASASSSAPGAGGAAVRTRRGGSGTSGSAHGQQPSAPKAPSASGGAGAIAASGSAPLAGAVALGTPLTGHVSRDGVVSAASSGFGGALELGFMASAEAL